MKVARVMSALALICAADAFLVSSHGSCKMRSRADTSRLTMAAASPKASSPMFEYLKFDGKPTFDVVQSTKDYIEHQSAGGIPDEARFDKEYVLRGPVIGPIVRADLAGSQKGLGLTLAFPNLSVDSFGYTLDPENPYRCLYFQRWRAKHEGDLDAYGQVFPATETEVEPPLSFSACFLWCGHQRPRSFTRGWVRWSIASREIRRAKLRYLGCSTVRG